MLAFLDLSSNIWKLLDFARYKPFSMIPWDKHDEIEKKIEEIWKWDLKIRNWGQNDQNTPDSKTMALKPRFFIKIFYKNEVLEFK